MPTCTLKDLKEMEPFLLRNLARHLGVSKWAHKERAELIADILVAQGEVKISPSPIEPVVEDIHTKIANDMFEKAEEVKPRIVITPISEAIAAPIPKEVKKVPVLTKKNKVKSDSKAPTLYAILTEMVQKKEENKDTIIAAVHKHHPERTRQEILKTLSVVKCQCKKKGGK